MNMKLPVQIAAAGFAPAGRVICVAISATILLQGSSIPATGARTAPGDSRPALPRSGSASAKASTAGGRLAAKLSPGARSGLRGSGSHGYIVQLRKPATAADCDALRRAGARVTRRYARLPMAAVTADGPALARLAALSNVTHVSPD